MNFELCLFSEAVNGSFCVMGLTLILQETFDRHDLRERNYFRHLVNVTVKKEKQNTLQMKLGIANV